MFQAIFNDISGETGVILSNSKSSTAIEQTPSTIIKVSGETF